MKREISRRVGRVAGMEVIGSTYTKDLEVKYFGKRSLGSP